MAKKSSAGVIVALLGAGIVGYIALAPSTSTAAPVKPSGSGGPAPGPLPGPASVPSGSCQLDANIDPALRAEVNAALNSTTLSPADYEGVAQTADQAGYPMAATCLRQKGAAVKVQQQVNLDTKGGMPFTIRQGDFPATLALYYTGNPQRFHDLEQLNPQLGSIQTINGVSNYYNAAGQPTWIPGTQILIPKSWDPLSKPIPPVATGEGQSPMIVSGQVAGTGPDTSGGDPFSQFLSALQGTPASGGF